MLGGKPLIAWTIEAALESDCYDRVIVTSDIDEVTRLASQMGTSCWSRPPVPDLQPDIEWVTEIMNAWPSFDTFSILRPTSPFRSADTIREAWLRWVQVMHEVDSLRTVRRVSEHPYKMWDETGPLYQDINNWDGIPKDQPWNLPTQSLPPFYIQTAGLEIAHTRALPHSISGDRVAPFIIEGPAALDINTLQDMWVAEQYVREGLV